MGLFGVFAGSSVALALFLSSFFLGIKRKEDPKNVWVGMILLAVALRIGKSIFFFLLNDMAPIGLAIGFLGLASIGPFTWLLLRRNATNYWYDRLHFAVPIVGAIICFVLSPSPWETILYMSATGLLLVYLVFSWKEWFYSEIENEKRWSRNVLIMVSGIWAAFVYQHLSFNMMGYAWGAILASVFLYWIFIQSFKTGILPRGLSISLPDQAISQVREALEKEELYTEQGMNLQLFANTLKLPTYLVTRSVKHLYSRSFPETLNHFRIEKIKQMLLDPKKEHLKIESLAYDVGFASPSAFYAAFKKYTGQTPTAYQKEAERMSA